jgi:hypothetical protein
VDTQHPHKEAQTQPEHKEGLSTVSKKGP